MNGRKFARQGTPRPEKKAGWSLRVAAGLAGVVMLLANASRLARDTSPETVAAVVVCTVLGLYLWNRKVAGGLGDFESLEALSDAVSESAGARRAHLVWYEYVIARNVARGTYAGEPPRDFRSDVYAASRGMGMATPSSRQQVKWLFVTLAVLAVGASLWMSEGDLDSLLIGLGLFGSVLAVSAGVMLLFFRSLDRGPLAALGTRVDEAAVLPTAQRWETLMRIARDENALSSSA